MIEVYGPYGWAASAGHPEHIRVVSSTEQGSTRLALALGTASCPRVGADLRRPSDVDRGSRGHPRRRRSASAVKFLHLGRARKGADPRERQKAPRTTPSDGRPVILFQHYQHYRMDTFGPVLWPRHKPTR